MRFSVNVIGFVSYGFVLVSEKRRAEAARIRDKYPDRIPVSVDLFYGIDEFFVAFNIIA